MDSEISDLLNKSIERLLKWIDRNEYRGYDPADGNSSFLFPMTFGNVYLQRCLQQLILRSPVNLRPLLGVRATDCAKARGYFGWGYVRLYRVTNDTAYEKRAKECFEWLIQHRSPFSERYCWGDHFHYATRGGKRAKDEPTLVWTGLIGHSFLDAFETWKCEHYKGVVESICDWILALPRETAKDGECLSYVSNRNLSIHNANVIGASFLARCYKIFRDPHCLDVAEKAVMYTCSRQRADGSWYYAEAPKYHWIDNFHTGYNLEYMLAYWNCVEDTRVGEAISKGWRFFLDHFIGPNGETRYYHDRTYPIDIQSCSQSISVLSLFSGLYPEGRDLADRVFRWTVENMQSSEGFFYYRDLGWKKVKVPMIHWGQATMLKAMADLVCSRSVI